MRFVNVKVYTLQTGNITATAVATHGDRIIAVGKARDLPAEGDEIDLGGHTMLPGLTDAHAHLRNLAEARRSVNLKGARSPQEAADRVAIRARERDAGSWITGRGWDQTRWPGAVFPDSGSLNAAAPENPVALTRVDGHALWVNRAAMAAAEITDQTPDPAGGRILRDPAGHATGILIDAAAGLVRFRIPETAVPDLTAAVSAAIDECLRYGLTGVHEMGVDQRTIDVYKSLIDGGRFPFRVLAAINGPGDTWKEWRERGPERRYGERLSVSAIKVYADGALGSRGAALLAPYADDPDNSGLELAGSADLERWTRDAVEHGFQVCIHAIGDRGNRTVLDVFERVLRDHPNGDRRLRDEHAQMLSASDLPRFKRLGVIPSMQPTHCTSDSDWAGERLGPERSALAYAWRSLIDSGVVIAGGSDFPVESPNPMLGIAAAVTREQPGSGRGAWHPEQRMTRTEAIHSFTSWAAYAGFDEEVSGTIEPGKYADMVVLDRDIMTCPQDEIAGTRVLMTVSGGEIVYRDSSAW